MYKRQGNIGLGEAAQSTERVRVSGNVRVDGDLVVTGRGGVSADKYITRRYVGDGTTLNFAITTYTGVAHTASSVLVFLNGVAQLGGTTAQVTASTHNYSCSGTNVTFGSGDAPLASDVVHIIELPI